MNAFKTGVLFLILTFILLATGYLIGGVEGVVLFLVVSLAMNFFGFWFSDRLVLAMTRAKEVPAPQAPDLHAIVDEQVRLAGMPKPRVCMIDTDSPNAFATGRDKEHATIAVTRGIMGMLNREELGGVIAHELAHVGNRDTLIMTLVAAMAGAVSMIAWMAQWSLLFGGHRRSGGGGPLALVGLLIVVVVMPMAALLVRLAISRAREYQADQTGARTSGRPLALASALAKLERGSQLRPIQEISKERLEPAAHLFIVNPLRAGGMVRLFATHPPLQDRVRRLQALA